MSASTSATAAEFYDIVDSLPMTRHLLQLVAEYRAADRNVVAAIVDKSCPVGDALDAANTAARRLAAAIERAEDTTRHLRKPVRP